MAVLPVQNNTGGLYARNPTLLPNFDKSVGNGGTIDHESPGVFLTNNPRVNATETVTLSGTTNTSDTVALTFTHALLPAGAVTVTYTVAASDSIVAEVAEGLASLINSTASLQNFGIFATAAEAVVTVNWPGPVGNFCTVTSAVVGSTDEVVSLGNGGVFASGSGPIIVTGNFNFGKGGSISSFFYGTPYILGYDVITAMVAQGMPIE
jgi:hypothetical protein